MIFKKSNLIKNWNQNNNENQINGNNLEQYFDDIRAILYQPAAQEKFGLHHIFNSNELNLSIKTALNSLGISDLGKIADYINENLEWEDEPPAEWRVRDILNTSDEFIVKRGNANINLYGLPYDADKMDLAIKTYDYSKNGTMWNINDIDWKFYLDLIKQTNLSRSMIFDDKRPDPETVSKILKGSKDIISRRAFARLFDDFASLPENKAMADEIRKYEEIALYKAKHEAPSKNRKDLAKIEDIDWQFYLSIVKKYKFTRNYLFGYRFKDEVYEIEGVKYTQKELINKVGGSDKTIERLLTQMERLGEYKTLASEIREAEKIALAEAMKMTGKKTIENITITSIDWDYLVEILENNLFININGIFRNRSIIYRSHLGSLSVEQLQNRLFKTKSKLLSRQSFWNLVEELKNDNIKKYNLIKQLDTRNSRYIQENYRTLEYKKNFERGLKESSKLSEREKIAEWSYNERTVNNLSWEKIAQKMALPTDQGGLGIEMDFSAIEKTVKSRYNIENKYIRHTKEELDKACNWAYNEYTVNNLSWEKISTKMALPVEQGGLGMTMNPQQIIKATKRRFEVTKNSSKSSASEIADKKWKPIIDSAIEILNDAKNKGISISWREIARRLDVDSKDLKLKVEAKLGNLPE